MKPELKDFSRQYREALGGYLTHGRASDLQAAQGLGRTAIALGLDTVDLTRVHEHALIKLVARAFPRLRSVMVRRAGTFFVETISSLEKRQRPGQKAHIPLAQLNERLHQQSLDLAMSQRQLNQEILRRRLMEKSLRTSEQHYTRLLERSHQMQEQLRFLSRQLLSAQEEERKKISRELHDVIAQTLTGINVQLATLKKDVDLNSRGLGRKIVRTQELVERSVKIVHEFARALRPAVLDDLGLIPALHTFMKGFMAETGIRVTLSAFATVERVNGNKRTVLYRVAQEALTNVARHAQASQAHVKIEKANGTIYMKIKDNGQGFPAERWLETTTHKRLGLLGMRERLEMVGGSVTIQSAPGKGTTIHAKIPLAKERKNAGTVDSPSK